MEAAKTIQVSRFAKENNLPFYLTLAYLFLEYLRPQSAVPALSALHLPAITTVLLMVALGLSGLVDIRIPQTRLFGALLLLMAVHVPFAVNNYWAYEMTRVMVMTFVGYLAIVTFVNTLEKFRRMISLWIAIHLYLAISGIIRGGSGTDGFAADTNDFALVLNMVIPFSLFGALKANDLSKRILLFMITGIFAVCVLMTSSRGGFLGLVAVGLYSWVKSPHKIASTFSIGILILVMLYFAPESYWEKMQTIQEEAAAEVSVGTGGDRLHSWKAAWNMFLDYPILGVGPGNFPWNVEPYEGTEGYGGTFHGGRVAHSLYFTLMPELGTVGILIFGGMLYYIFRDLRFLRQLGSGRGFEGVLGGTKEEVYLSLTMTASLMGFLVSGTFLSVLYYPSFWILMGFVVALRKASDSGYEKNFASH